MKRLLLTVILSVSPILMWAQDTYIANFDVTAYVNKEFTGEQLQQIEAGEMMGVTAINQEQGWAEVMLLEGRTGYVDLTSIELVISPGESADFREDGIQAKEQKEAAVTAKHGRRLGPIMRIISGIWLSIIFALTALIFFRFRKFPLDKASEDQWLTLTAILSVIGIIYLIGGSSYYSLKEVTTWFIYKVGFWRFLLHIIFFIAFCVMLASNALKLPLRNVLHMIQNYCKRGNDSNNPAQYTKKEAIVTVLFWAFIIIPLLQLLAMATMLALAIGIIALIFGVFSLGGGWASTFGSDKVSLSRNEKTGDLEDATGNIWRDKGDDSAEKM